MAGVYAFPEYRERRPRVSICPDTGMRINAHYNQTKAQYHQLSYLHRGFKDNPLYGLPTSLMPPSPQDPYSMYVHHSYHPEYDNQNMRPMPYPQTTMYKAGSGDLVAFNGSRLPVYNQGQVQVSFPQNDRLPDKKIDDIRKTAKSFVDACCPLLGEKPYCLPPIKRYRHPDKSNKKLVQGMESEKRVFGSFERYFAEKNIPVFMLCYYPLSGFLQVYKTEHVDKVLMTPTGQNSKDAVMILLSSTFSVTVVLVNTTIGSSQFEHIRRRVLKAVTHSKELSSTVSKWLTMLGVRSEVRQVIAFPNLKRAVMERVCKDKHSLGSVCTLHVDELSAPFEEEWSDPVQQRLFHVWILQNVLCYNASLSQDDLHLVVGALVSPKLSKVDFVHEGKMIMPIPNSIQYADAVEDQTEKVGQMKLTIDGITKSFDEFMDEYVTCYYPKVEERTYRVPPVHFNIHSLKKPSEYISAIKADAMVSSINGAPGNNESKNLENYLPVHLSKMAGNSEDTSCNHLGETNQIVSTPQSFISVGKNSNHSSQEDPASATFQCQYSSAKNHQISDYITVATGGELLLRDSNDQDSQPSRNSPDKHVLLSGIYFKEGPHSSSSLLCSDDTSTILTSHLYVTSASYARSELSDSSVSVSGSSAHVNLQALQDVEILSKVMDKDVRKDEGENRVISALEMLGNQTNLGGQQEDPMFIICGYQYNNYLNKLREEMFYKEEMNRPVRAFGQTMRAEHDCLIFHKEYGAIIVCIKAIGDNFEEWHATEDQKIACTKKILEKGLKQLRREEAMIRHVTSDLSVELKCHKLIALPNMSRESLKAAIWTDLQLKKTIRETLGHEADLFLCSDELPPKHQSLWDCTEDKVKEGLVSWWKRVKVFLKDNDNGGIELRVYKQLIGRYCGLFSTVEVWSPTNPRMEVRSASEAIKTCAQRFCKFVLLPCQLKALCSNDRKVFVYGPPGSGKTLVLLLKAKQWLLAGETVVLVNSRPGSNMGFPYAYGVYKRLVHMMVESKVPLCKLYMINIDCLQFKEDELAGITPAACIIMDEVTPASHKVIETLCHRKFNSIWCAGLFEEDKPNTAHIFSIHKMDKIIRCPPAVQSVLRHTEEAVRIRKPYEKIYQSTVMEQEHTVLNNDNYNKHANNILKCHVAYCSQLQEGYRPCSKSLTSKYSRSLLGRPVKITFPNHPSHFIIENKTRKDPSAGESDPFFDTMRTRHSLYCSEPQKKYLLSNKSLKEKASLLGSSEARRAYQQTTLQLLSGKDTSVENKISNSVLLDENCEENCESVPVISESGQKSTQTRSTDFCKKTLLRNGSLCDEWHVHQFTQLISDCLDNIENQNVDIETRNKCSDLLIKSYVNVMKRCSKRLQIEASSDTHQQQQITDRLSQECSANNSAKVTDNRKVKILDTEELKYDSESLNKRLTENYGHGCNLESEEPSLRKVKILDTEELKYDSESLNKRLAENYGHGCNLKSQNPSINETVHVSVHHEVQPMPSGDLKYDQKSLQNRFVEKYGNGCHCKSEKSFKFQSNFLHEIKYSEALNKRLMEKFNSPFKGLLLDLSQQEAIDKLPKTSSYNNNNVRCVSQDTQHSIIPGSQILENKGNVSTNFRENQKSNSDMLNKRIQKYGRKPEQTPKEELTIDQLSNCGSHTEISLPTDGPQPHIIDHSLHSQTGNPIHCKDCVHELIEFLNTMIMPEDVSVFPKRKHIDKNQHFLETKVSSRSSSDSGSDLFSNASSVYTKLPKGSFFNKSGVFENRALNWSDVLIVAKETTENSAFVKVLKSKNIPVEVCVGERAHRIEDAKEKKLFITSYKETTGIERAIIVFVPSDRSVSSQKSLGQVNNIDLKLANCINLLSEEDKAVLWYVASRSLASLVLILP